MKNINKSFTLVELLVVVTILAILAGGAIAVFDGVGRRAAKGQAINDMSQLTRIIKNYQATQRTLPSNFDSLLKVVGPTLAVDADYSPDGTTNRNSLFGAVDGNGDSIDPTNGSANIYEILPGQLRVGLNFVNWLSEELIGSTSNRPKILRVRHSYETLNALTNAGIRELRFIDIAGDHSNANGSSITVSSVSGLAGQTIGRADDVLNPSQIFEQPLDNTNPTVAVNLINLGRGFTFPIIQDSTNDTVSILSNQQGNAVNPATFASDGMVLATWNPGPLGAENVLVGANATDILVAFGIGNNSTLINSRVVSTDVNSSDTSVGLGEAPAYGAPIRATYSRYIALFKVGELVDINSQPSLALLSTGNGGATFGGNDPQSGLGDLGPHYAETALGGSASGPLVAHVPGTTAGVLALDTATFVAIVDCFGNSIQGLNNQFNSN